MQTLDLVFEFFIVRNCHFCRIVQLSILPITKCRRCEVKTLDLVFVVREYLFCRIVQWSILLIAKCRCCKVKTLDLVDVFFVLRNCLFCRIVQWSILQIIRCRRCQVISILLEKRCSHPGVEPGTSQLHTHALTNYTKDHHWRFGANIYYSMRMLARICTPHEPTTPTLHHCRATL